MLNVPGAFPAVAAPAALKIARNAAPGEAKGSDSYLAYTFNAAGTYYIGVSNNVNKGYEPRFGYGDTGVGTTGGYKLSLVNVPVAPVMVTFNRATAGPISQKHDAAEESDQVRLAQ